MARTPRVIQTIAALRKAVSTYRKGGDKVALVPTMGALHDGHMSLVEAANKKAGRVIVSIFVNPQQFAPTEDFATYPRTMNTDVARLKRLEVDAVWAPEIAVIPLHSTRPIAMMWRRTQRSASRAIGTPRVA